MGKHTKLVTFRAVASPAAGWTDVVVQHVVDGKAAGEVVINSFGGTKNGKPEAQRFAGALNAAVERFHLGDVQTLVQVGDEGQCTNCGEQCSPVYGPHESVRRGFDVYLGKCCGGDKLTLKAARRLVGIEDDD